MQEIRAILAIYLWAAAVLSACGRAAAAQQGVGFTGVPAPVTQNATKEKTPVEEGLIVAAAADLQFAFQEIAEQFEAQTGHHVILVFGSTGQLTQQIENGAPYDLFAAANIEFIQKLAREGMVLPDSVALYARGRIVLAVNQQSGIVVQSLSDLLQPGITHVAIANPEHAPYGLAAKQALEAAGIWEQLKPKLVLAENVRQALQFIQTGDSQAGIISLSVANVPEIRWVLIDDRLHNPLDQALAIVASTSQPELAAQFAAYINGEYGRPVMRRYGFILPDEIPLMTTP